MISTILISPVSSSPSMAGLNWRRSSPRSRPETRMPATPSGMSGSTSIIELPFWYPRAADDQHRTLGVLRHGSADRAEKHAGESAPAMAPDHHQLCPLGFIDEPAGRLITHDSSGHLHIWVLFVPSGEAFAQHFVTLVFVFLPVHAQNRQDTDIAPCV